MKCNNCKVAIGQQFIFAIKMNQCPACGSQLMHTEKLASYISLQQLLKNNFSNLEVEKITSLIIANFEIKQLFKDESPQMENNTVEVIEDIESDEAYKKAQMEDARKQIREQEFENALKAQYGLDGSGGDDDGSEIFNKTDDSNIDLKEQARRMLEDVKKNEKYENMLSGSGGFTRSS